MHRFYVEHPASAGKTAVLSPEESAHAARVLRLRPGEEIVLLDGQTLWSAKLEVVNDRACEARVLSALPSPEPCAKVTLIQGLPSRTSWNGLCRRPPSWVYGRCGPWR